MTELSIIVPFVNEYPQVMFTIRNIAESLKDRIDFEILAVNNYCSQVEQQVQTQTAMEVERLSKHLQKTGYKANGKLKAFMDTTIQAYMDDRGGGSVKACSKGHHWLEYLEYTDKLSHWNAKRVGCNKAKGDYFLFIDAHCIVGRDSIFDMLQYYKEHEEELNGTIHLPLTYKILEWHRLIYKLVVHDDANGQPAEFTYSFTPLRNLEVHKMPCMSTCGMLMSRKVYEEVGGWPAELGIYGGGENFMNYTLSVLGYDKWIYSDGWCCHHGEKRGYHWYYDDNIRNRILATYLFGGEVVAKRFVSVAKGRPETLDRMLEDIMKKCRPHRIYIKERQKISIDEWTKIWR